MSIYQTTLRKYDNSYCEQRKSHKVIELRLFLKFGVPVLLSFLFNVAFANEELQQAMNDPSNLTSWGGNYQGTRYSRLDQINTENVHKLTPVWTFSTGVKGNYQGSPLVVDNVIYFHTPNIDRLYAVDLSNQTIKWQAEYAFSKKTIPKHEGVPALDKQETDLTNQGLAFAQGKIFWHRLNGELEARDAKTGKIIWTVTNGDLKAGIVGGTAPIVVGSKVIVGMAGVQMDLFDYHGNRGYITAYDIDEGTLLWRGFSMGTDKETLIDPNKTKSWKDGRMQLIGHNEAINSQTNTKIKVRGGAPSGWISYDSDLNLIYYGTGSAKQEYSAFASSRGGLNATKHYFIATSADKFGTSSLWARDANTGKVKWLYQMTPNDQWGFSGTNESILVDQKMNGEYQQVLVHFDKNGFVYTFERQTGALLKATKFDEIVNWAKEVDMHTGMPIVEPSQDALAKVAEGQQGVGSRVCPSDNGAKMIQPAAYSPKTELFYLGVTRKCMSSTLYKYNDNRVGLELSRTYHYSNRPEMPYDPGDEAGILQAWDNTTGKQKWQIIEPYELRTGILATQGNVVFYGTLEGYFNAVNAETGEVLYKYKMPMGTLGNINTWLYNGKQYVGVFAGKNRMVDKNMGDFCGKAYVDGLRPQTQKEKKFYIEIYEQLCLQEQGGVLFSFGLTNN